LRAFRYALAKAILHDHGCLVRGLLRIHPMSLPDSDDARWFAEEVLPHDRALRGYLRGSFPSVRDVEDVVQESYLRIWRTRAAQPIRSARGFLFRIARNLALDNVRHTQASPIDALGSLEALSVVEERPTAADLLTREERSRLVGQALARLPGRCREAIFLHKIKGLSQKAVADQLGLSEKTVANQVGLGVKRCEQFFRDRGIESF